jgi:hypothetical protein
MAVWRCDFEGLRSAAISSWVEALSSLRGGGRGLFTAGEPIDTAAGFVNASGVVTAVVNPLFIEVGHIDSAVRAGLDVDGAEPGVVGFEHTFDVFGFEGRLQGANVAENNLSLEWFDAEQPAAVAFRECWFFVDNEVMTEAGNAVVFDVFEETERIGV